MNGSRRLAVLAIVALTGLGTAAGSVAAAPALGTDDCTSVSSYDYDPDTREGLIARRSAFDPSDGLQRWERLLLAMDPNGAANVGR